MVVTLMNVVPLPVPILLDLLPSDQSMVMLVAHQPILSYLFVLLLMLMVV